MFTLHLSLTTHQYKLGGSASLSPFTQKGDICSLLESVIGAACSYLFWRTRRRLQEILCQGHETKPDQESYRKQRGSCWVDPHSCLGDVTQHFTGSFSILMTSVKPP